MQKYQYFEWGSTLNLDGFKIIIFWYIICEPFRSWKEGLVKLDVNLWEIWRKFKCRRSISAPLPVSSFTILSAANAASFSHNITHPFHTSPYLAVCMSSFSSGSSLDTAIPLFILAGSRAQLDMPMKATFLYLGMSNSSSSEPVSSNGCRLWKSVQYHHTMWILHIYVELLFKLKFICYLFPYTKCNDKLVYI